MNLKLDDFESSLIEEISIISGHSPGTIRDVLEATFLRQLESAMDTRQIDIPFIGRVLTKYKGDDFVAGTRVANIECLFSPSDLFKRIMGDVEDGESDIISQLLSKKMKIALQDILDK